LPNEALALVAELLGAVEQIADAGLGRLERALLVGAFALDPFEALHECELLSLRPLSALGEVVALAA
jgi:hypothetical protein